jgi:hypothetical protein
VNRTELLAAVRTQARLSDSDDDYTDARIAIELTDALKSVFGSPIVEARAGAWLKQLDSTGDGSRYRFRMPYRAFAMESIELVDASGSYEIIGDQIVFAAAPDNTGIVRCTCYLSPSLITQEQTAGRVTAVSTTLRTITVSSLPVNRVTAATIATGDLLDIVHANGWHELALVGVASTVSGTTLTFPAGTDLSDVVAGAAGVGDMVRAAEQTDWPCLPDDFHRALCDVTAARVLRARGYLSKASEIEKQVAGDIARFADALEPRVKAATNVVTPTGILLRGGGRRRGSSPTRFGGW